MVLSRILLLLHTLWLLCLTLLFFQLPLLSSWVRLVFMFSSKSLSSISSLSAPVCSFEIMTLADLVCRRWSEYYWGSALCWYRLSPFATLLSIPHWSKLRCNSALVSSCFQRIHIPSIHFGQIEKNWLRCCLVCHDLPRKTAPGDTCCSQDCGLVLYVPPQFLAFVFPVSDLNWIRNYRLRLSVGGLLCLHKNA